MTICEVCGASIETALEPKHSDWHAALEERLKRLDNKTELAWSTAATASRSPYSIGGW